MMSHPQDHLLNWTSPGGHQISLHLTPERALWWPAERTVFVADLHLGKAAVFRARGLPVPRGTTSGTLQRLSQVMERLAARKLVVLGDFLHARESHAAPTLAALREWRLRHVEVECIVVQGNHDRHAGAVEASLGFIAQAQAYLGPGLVGVHESHEAREALARLADTPLVLAGHVHPVVTLRGSLDRLRLPCFWLRRDITHTTLTLPSFGEFTGGFDVSQQAGQVFIVAERVQALARSSAPSTGL